MASLVTVVAEKGSDKKAHDRVVLWEQHPDHPDGEAYIVRDGKPVQVALTPKVKQLIAEDNLTKVEGGRMGSEIVVKDNRAAPLREATEEEEDNAEPPLETQVEKATAKVPTEIPGIRRGGRPERGK